MGLLNIPYLCFLALSPNGVLKMNEVAPGTLESDVSTKSLENNHHASPEHYMDADMLQPAGAQAAPPPFSLYSFITRALELLSNPRGVGWKFGTGTDVQVSKDWRDLSSRAVFRRQTSLAIVKTYLVFDACNTLLEHADVRVPGGKLLGRGSNRVESLMIATVLTVASNLLLISSKFDIPLFRWWYPSA